MYKAIQTELVRIQTEPDATEGQDIGPQSEQQHCFRRRLTQLSEEGDTDDEIFKCYEEEVEQSHKKSGMCISTVYYILLVNSHASDSCYVL